MWILMTDYKIAKCFCVCVCVCVLKFCRLFGFGKEMGIWRGYALALLQPMAVFFLLTKGLGFFFSFLVATRNGRS